MKILVFGGSGKIGSAVAWDLAKDPEVTALALGFPVAIAARMLARGTVEKPGIVPPEDVITGKLYAWFIAELGRRNIRIEESVSEGETRMTAVD